MDCKVLDKRCSRCSDHGVVVLFADADAVSGDGNMGDLREVTEKGPFIERAGVLLAWLRLHFLSVLRVVNPKVTVGLCLLEKHEVEHVFKKHTKSQDSLKTRSHSHTDTNLLH